MSRRWKRLTSSLHTAEGRDFERATLPFIRTIWADVIIPQPLRSSYDQNGVDMLAWRGVNTQSIFLAVQCKGFGVKEYELGDAQIRQIKESIDRFINSGLRAHTYVLLHNRIPNNPTFRKEMDRQTIRLKDSGMVSEVGIWGPQRLLQEATKAVRNRCLQILQLNESMVEQILNDSLAVKPIEEVPLRLSAVKFNKNRMLGESRIAVTIADPSKELLRTSGSNLCLVLGRAGYGKTTAALRTLVDRSKRVFYLSAATLPRDVGNTDTLIRRWIKLDKLFEGVLEEDFPILEQLSATALDYILKDQETPIILILDALDESIYFSRPGGLQQLFNQISDVRVPVILLARSEFWESKQEDFAKSYGLRSRRKEHIQTGTVRVIRLNDWDHNQIKLLAERYQRTLHGQERRNVDEFVRIIDSGEYEDIYGDIPKRPLFLRFILDSVAEQGIQRKGRARLFYDWIVMKIRRDVLNPVRLGGQGRVPIVQSAEETETTIRLAFKAMKLAAYNMTSVSELNALELLPSCNIDDVLLSDERLKAIMDPTGLFLHSLLIPAHMNAEKLEVSFAHRTYQEFFLALYIRDHETKFVRVKLPKAIEDYLEMLKTEKI